MSIPVEIFLSAPPPPPPPGDEHREQFEEWLSIHAKSTRSSVTSMTEYEEIKRYLLNGNQSESKLIEMSKVE